MTPPPEMPAAAPAGPCAAKAEPATSPAVDVLARTLYGEARGESLRGKEAVACVIMNRLHIATAQPGHRWGSTVEEVCLSPWQFSCWNEDDPHRNALEAANEGDAVFASCVRIARRAVRNVLADPTGGATHYHAMGALPFWARGQTPTAIIGGHVFYTGID